MKVLMLSRDAKIFDKGSAVRARMVEYGKLFENLYICVISIGKYKEERISPNVFVFHEPLSSLWGIGNIVKRVRGDIDIVTAQDPFETGFIASRLASALNAKLQLQVHTDVFSPYFARASIKNFIRKMFLRRTLLRADCIRVVSEKIKNSLATSYKLQATSCAVLPIWIDAEKIKNAQPTSLPKRYDFTILWVGRLEKEKNPMLALEAFNIFQRHVPNSCLVIIGDGSERNDPELQVTRYKLQNNVLFLGWQNDVAGYYKGADALLVTSWYEGYGLQMVEARVAGIPVVATDVGVAHEVGAYIAEHTPQSLGEILLRLYKKELPKPLEYKYPYKDKEEYLRLYKQSFEQCLLNHRK
ncbi:MAG: glycosyltransferase [Parcubacteria group bacterium]|nr:glycosyltransferase [Parcubacteria group bacterium]